ncbi:phosphatase PAP2 family protein [Sphingomicrobium sp. XHP0235]|uniref:phosphatase PAP2 family protein n=1 Tax=Sphingomicrobium aquimarinum TaxID=3133971 RepID=UPI0031FF1262
MTKRGVRIPTSAHPWALASFLTVLWLLALFLGGAESDLDRRIFLALHPGEQSSLVKLAWAITWLGDWLVLVPIGGLATGLLFSQGRRLDAFALVATIVVVRILVALQKILFNRDRPDFEQWMIEYSASFPSAHAANSAVTFLAIAILMKKSRLAIIIAVVLAAAVGLSRIVLGVHWPTDVIGGWAFAGLALLIFSRVRGRQNC